MMKNVWKIGVKSQAIRLSGLSGWAGASGMAAGGSVGVGVGAAVVPGAGEGGGKHAATVSRTTTIEQGGAEPRSEVANGQPAPSSSDRVVAARVPGWQRAIRFMPIQLPLNSPYRSIACSV